MDGLSRIVKGYRDRVQRNGGSVSVTGDGAVLATMRSLSTGGVGTIASEQLAFFDQASPARTVLQTGRGNLEIINATGGAFANLRVNGIAAGSITASGTLTVSGTGTHSFSGPVQVSNAVVSRVSASGTWFRGETEAGTHRFRIDRESNSDVGFKVVESTGNTVITALQIVNANGYVSVATRLGVGTASPGYTMENVGSTYLQGNAGVGAAPGSIVSARLTVSANTASMVGAIVTQSAANATAPVLVVKLGATPGGGSDAIQVQDSNGNAMFRAGNGITLTGYASNPVITMYKRTSAPATPGADSVSLWWDEAAKAFKYIASDGVPRTITAA